MSAYLDASLGDQKCVLEHIRIQLNLHDDLSRVYGKYPEFGSEHQKFILHRIECDEVRNFKC